MEYNAIYERFRARRIPSTSETYTFRGQNVYVLPKLKRSSLMQKTADQSNKHTRETISVTYICI